MNEAEDAIDNNTATCSASNPSANKPQLEGREIKDSPYKLIGKCFAAGKQNAVLVLNTSIIEVQIVETSV